MISIHHPRDMTRLRRLALAAQGLVQKAPFGRGLNGARNAINHLGYVQIDTISVVERAHHHVLHARVPGFRPSMIQQMLLAGDIFEYWAHAAAFLPMADFRFSLPYKQAIKNGQVHWYRSPDRKLMAELLARVRTDGPLRSRDLETPPNKKAGWWDWKPAKKALEQLFMEGELMVSSREGFQKSYDLTERVLPSRINTSMPGSEEFAAHLLDQQLLCHGLVSLKGLTYLRKNTELRNAMRTTINTRLALNELQQLQLPNGEIYFIKAGGLEQRLPRVTDRVLILSPFDNCLIQRDRLKALFQFDYQLECYLPEAKRRYGYFSLPLLFRDSFIGRIDCKAHRKTRHLEIKSLHFEQDIGDEDRMIAAFADAVTDFLPFQQCESVSLLEAYPARFSSPLRKALKSFE